MPTRSVAAGSRLKLQLKLKAMQPGIRLHSINGMLRETVTRIDNESTNPAAAGLAERKLQFTRIVSRVDCLPRRKGELSATEPLPLDIELAVPKMFDGVAPTFHTEDTTVSHKITIVLKLQEGRTLGLDSFTVSIPVQIAHPYASGSAAAADGAGSAVEQEVEWLPEYRPMSRSPSVATLPPAYITLSRLPPCYDCDGTYEDNPNADPDQHHLHSHSHSAAGSHSEAGSQVPAAAAV
ncbi:hypothetical protein GQ42DRAFT_46888 [Ramicandelaber brevisporus]|nr:hypothetical protein GQ42DRAFT_46888 [Ramicandelaber brevisporus]